MNFDTDGEVGETGGADAGEGVGSNAISLVRLDDVMRRTALRRTAVYELIKEGRFPRPVKMGRASAWVDAEITRWIQSLMAARDGRTSL